MEIIRPETAELAKQLGFNTPVQNRWWCNGTQLNQDGQLRYGQPLNYNDPCFQDEYRKYTSAPTQEELKKWLRETHNIEAFPVHRAKYNSIPVDKWYVFKERPAGASTVTLYDSYEAAMEASLKETLKILY